MIHGLYLNLYCRLLPRALPPRLSLGPLPAPSRFSSLRSRRKLQRRLAEPNWAPLSDTNDCRRSPHTAKCTRPLTDPSKRLTLLHFHGFIHRLARAFLSPFVFTADYSNYLLLWFFAKAPKHLLAVPLFFPYASSGASKDTLCLFSCRPLQKTLWTVSLGCTTKWS